MNNPYRPMPPGAYPPHTGPAPLKHNKHSQRGSSPWNIWEALLVVGLFAASQPLLSLALSLGLDSLVPPALPGETNEVRLLKYLLPLMILLSHALGWLMLFLLIVGRHGLPFSSGLGFKTPAKFRLTRYFLGGIGLYLLGILMMVLIPPSEERTNPLALFLAYGWWAVALVFLMAVVMAPFLEEALFRGILLPALQRRLSFHLSAILVTVLFTGLHATQVGDYLPALFLIGVCGYILAHLRQKHESLWPPIVFHMGFNFTPIVLIVMLYAFRDPG